VFAGDRVGENEASAAGRVRGSSRHSAEGMRRASALRAADVGRLTQEIVTTTSSERTNRMEVHDVLPSVKVVK